MRNAFSIGKLSGKRMADNSNESRFKNSTINASTAMISQIVMGIVCFLERMVFNQYFISDYLGFYSLFRNVISVLSVADLGLNVAIAYALYKPLAEDNYDEICAIMSFYKRVYAVVGTIILIGGLVFTPFLSFFVNTTVPINNVRLYFIIFLLGTVFEFYLSYKQILIEANQERYKITLAVNIFHAAMYLTQIGVSIFTGNFLLYSLCILIFDTSRCLFLRHLATKEFKYLKRKVTVKLSKASKDAMFSNIKGLIMSRIGSALVTSSDSILISTFVSSAVLGLYSNYQMITSGLIGFIRIIPNAITASLGNMGAVESSEKVADSYKSIDTCFFIIYGIFTIVLANIINPIIATFFGLDRCLPFSSAFLMCLVFYLSSNKSIFNTYKSSLGLFWFDRKRPIISGVANLVFSIIFANFMGLNGIILGTALTYFCIDLIIEPKIIFNKGFNTHSTRYIIYNMARLLMVIIMMLSTYYVTSFLPYAGILAIICRFAVALFISALVFFILYRKNIYVKQAYRAVRKFLFKKEA